MQTVIGPPLILALALQDVFFLHAGAVLVPGGAAAFLAESGGGKSTLARSMGMNGQTARRIGDDMLPVALGRDQLLATHHYPQLKLPVGDLPPPNTPAALPLQTLYILEAPDDQNDKDLIALQPLSKQEAMMALVRFTVAAQLFDQALLARHLTFCGEAAARTRVKRLIYPRRFDLLPAVQAAITADLNPSPRLKVD